MRNIFAIPHSSLIIAAIVLFAYGHAKGFLFDHILDKISEFLARRFRSALRLALLGRFFLLRIDFILNVLDVIKCYLLFNQRNTGWLSIKILIPFRLMFGKAADYLNIIPEERTQLVFFRALSHSIQTVRMGDPHSSFHKNPFRALFFINSL